MRWHQHLHAVFQNRRFVRRRCCLAFYHRVCFNDLERTSFWQFKPDRRVFVGFDRDDHAILEKLAFFLSHDVASQRHLLKGFLIHEGVQTAVAEKKLVLFLVQPHALDGFRRTKALVEFGAVAHFAQFNLQVRAALAGFDVLNFDRPPKPILVLDDVTGTDFVTVDLHNFVPMRGCLRRGCLTGGRVAVN